MSKSINPSSLLSLHGLISLAQGVTLIVYAQSVLNEGINLCIGLTEHLRGGMNKGDEES